MSNESGAKQKYALTSLMAALAVVFSLFKLTFPFILLAYLKFDLAEIPAAITFFLVGLRGAIIVALVHFMVLSLQGAFFPIGPLMKFLAVVSSLIGFYIGGKVVRGNPFSIQSFALSMSLAALSRILVMTMANIVVLIFILPQLLYYSLEIILLYTAFFNFLHVVLTFGVAYTIVKQIAKIMIESK
ncbi:MAG: hypothetical protein DRJ59_04480 [Thermoprotei archaeon]|nr:MAG: hypothetical protein DRJ59_04480 [Thermoprotei archaeon]